MTVAKEMFAAGPGCAAANGLLNSFETTKVKLQLHNAAKPVYNVPTTRGVLMQIAKEEGIVRGLMTPGLSASLTRSMLYGGYRVGLYSTAKEHLAGDGDPTLGDRMLSGMFTGGLGAVLSCPLDVVRTRMQADSGLIKNGKYVTGLRKGYSVRYRTMMSSFMTILKNEGLREGLYRGSSVTIARASLLNGAQLASYDTLKRWVDPNRDYEGLPLHFSCALASGVIAQTVVMPVDTIKSKVMMGEGWKSVAHAIHQNGPMWLYRGWLPACTGQGCIMVLQMPLIEEFRRILGLQAM